MHTSPANDVLLIGGGIIGCSIAYFLRKAGVEVTVVEKAKVGAEASSAAAGLLAPVAELATSEEHARLILASWALFPNLLAELEELSGVGVEFARPGALHMVPEGAQSALQTGLDSLQASGLEVEWLTGDEVRAREPLLSIASAGAIYAPQEASIKPELLTRAYAQAARKLGARFLEQTDICGIETSFARAVAVRTTSGEVIPCQRLIIAAGAWSAQVANWLQVAVPVQPMRGQILAVEQLKEPLQHILFGEEIYMVPKLDGTIYVGATVEEAGFDKALTVGGIAWLLERAMRLVPQMERAGIARMWTGLRPWSPDSSPILGGLPRWENVIVATGHSATGVMLSPITGQMIAELIVTGQTPELITPFAIERFSQRQME